MSRLPASPTQWMPLHLDAWRTKTRRLSPVERCAYMDLLIEYWDTQEPLEVNHDDFANLVGIPRAEWDVIAERVLRYFDVGEDGRLHSRRMDEEIAKAKRMLEQKREAGRKGGSARASTRQADAKQPLSECYEKEPKKQAAGTEAGTDPRGLHGPLRETSKSAKWSPDIDVLELMDKQEAQWHKSPSYKTIRQKALSMRMRGVS